jgi:ATP-binding cassette, subfamily B, bacterial
MPYIQAMEMAECGAASLAMVLAYHGKEIGLAEVREVTGTGRDGVDAFRIVEAARWYGMRARGVRADLHELHLLPPGTILHWNLNHFVVLDRIRRDAVDVVDPAGGRRRIPRSKFGLSYTGVAIVLDPGDDFVPGKRRAKGTWRYLRPMLRQARVVRRVLVISALIRVLALALPILTLVVVARVVPGHDHALFAAVLAAMAVMTLYHFGGSFLRARLLVQLRTHLDVSLELGFVDHLADLPYGFFLKRSAGDLMMRLRSNSTVRELLTTGTLAAVLDGGFILFYLVLLLVVNVPIALLVVGLGALEVLVLVLSRQRNRQLMAESLETEARSQSYVYQMLSGIETLKAAGAERRAVAHWTNLFVSEVNVSLRRGQLDALVESATAGLRLASPLAVLGLGAWLILVGNLSLATMLALGALAAAFLEPLATLVTTAFQLQLLGSYMDRINDVLETHREQQDVEVRMAPGLSGRMSAEAVSFRYSAPGPLVVEQVSVDIEPGMKVAIVGRSGSGKSTLAHLLLGLYRPTSGLVLYDGHDLAELDARSVRRQIGIVTQHAYLFNTSIRENIALTDPSLPLAAVQRAARLACIEEDIGEMAMGYETVLADGGASLSGGQRQRIALARALVHEPRILLLDEATSALDTITERRLYDNLRNLSCTSVVIAHRLSTVANSDLILVMDGGRVVERGTHSELLCSGDVYQELASGQSGRLEDR